MSEDSFIGIELSDGKYRVESHIGAGGMGSVYLGMNTRVNAPVAIKVLKPEFQSDEAVAARFKVEHLAPTHDNIVKVYEVQNEEAPSYIVMEYLDGFTLSKLIRENGAVDESIVQAVFLQVLQALNFLHGQGILHRDIKPSNIMIQPGVDGYDVKLIDFGIAKRPSGQAGGAGLTSYYQSRMLTAAYAPKEQFISLSAVTEQSDVYSTAICLFEALTGKVPYSFDDKDRGSLTYEEAYMRAHQTGRHPKPTKLNSSISSDWNRIVAKGMKPEKDERYQSAQEFLEDIAKVNFGPSRMTPILAGTGIVAAVAAAALFLLPLGSAKPPIEGMVSLPGATVTLPDQSALRVGNLFVQPTEVSNSEYGEFINQTQSRAPLHWKDGQPPSDALDAPVYNVDYRDALAYTKWISEVSGIEVRLPTIGEWYRIVQAHDRENIPFPSLFAGVEEWTSTQSENAADSILVCGSSARALSYTDRKEWLGFRCVADGPSPKLWKQILTAF